MIVFANTVTPRLQYVLDFIGNLTIGKPFEITTDVAVFRSYNNGKINYSNRKLDEPEFMIHNSGLLFETGIHQQSVNCFQTNNYKAFFKTEGEFPFDIFAAVFYLLSRYEEYMPYKRDVYGRYAHGNSLAFKEGFLHLPLVNIWIEDFKQALKKKFPASSLTDSAFAFLPTYDIDEAYAYSHKQWWRTAGGIIKSMVNGQWPAIAERIRVLRGRQEDPYDAFGWLNRLHKQYNLKPYYFFLIANNTGKYDKNILPSTQAMERLIKAHSDCYEIGIHPSWQSGDDEQRLRTEIANLTNISARQICSSRQHYIRFSLPGTYRQLISSGITSDFSMGYGSINGFRASVAWPFFWYDLEKEEQTTLILYPFCFMEANSFYEQKLSPGEAFDELMQYYHVVKSVNGMLITIWHNSFLGTANRFAGWREVYTRFLASVKF